MIVDTPDEVVEAGLLPPCARVAMSEHVVSGKILFPGVGYAEMVFASSLPQNLAHRVSLTAVTFLRPLEMSVTLEQYMRHVR